MTEEQIAALGPSFTSYLASFRCCFVCARTLAHLGTYCRGLLSDLRRKSVEPMALAGGTAVRTLQEFLAQHVWDEGRMRDELQRRVAREHLPAPGAAAAAGADVGVGTVGWVDETGVPKKGDKTPGVQRQWCGARGKVDNCLVTVHLACRRGDFMTMLDSELFLPRQSWHEDRARCEEAHVPESVVYRPKWQIALEQVRRALGNGIGFDWLTFDEWYGGKPRFLFGLDALGLLYVCEVPKNFRCFPSLLAAAGRRPRRRASRADDAVTWGKPFLGKKWRTVTLARQTLPPQVWEVKAGQVYLPDKKGPTGRTYWLVVARNVQTREVKYFVSNAPASAALETLMRVAFTRAGVEHVFRLAKSEIGFGHFEGRGYRGLLRHMTLCQLVMLFVAEQTERLRGEKRGGHDGAGGARVERAVPALAWPPPRKVRHRAGVVRHLLLPKAEQGRAEVQARCPQEAGVAL